MALAPTDSRHHDGPHHTPYAGRADSSSGRQLRWDRIAIAVSAVVSLRLLRATPWSRFAALALLAVLAALVLDGLIRGWLVEVARRVDQLVWVAILWAIMAIAWTGPGADVFTVFTSFAYGTVFALRIGACQRPRETLAIGMIAVTVASVALSVLQTLPADDGAIWAYEHKNAAGRVLCMAAVVLFAEAVDNDSRKRRRMFGFWCAVALVAMVATNSATPIVTLAFALPILWIHRRGRTNAIMVNQALLAALALLAFGVGVAVVGVAQFDPVAATNDLLGRSTTNNTALVRFDLWHDGISRILDQPIFGYGYTPFDKGDAVYSSGTSLARTFDPTNLHNSYLQLIYSFGIPFSIVAIPHTFRRIHQNYRSGLVTRTAVAVALAVLGMSYSIFFAGPLRSSFFWALALWAIYLTPTDEQRELVT